MSEGSSPMPDAYVTCPKCRAQNAVTSSSCFLCDTPLAGLPVETPERGGPARWRPTFRIGTLMLVIALVAGFLALWVQAWGLAVLLAFPASIALVRTIAKTRSDSMLPPTVELMLTFMATFLMVIWIMAASAAAFFFTCLAVASLPGQEAPYLPLILATFAAMATITGLVSLWVRFSRDSSRRS